MPRLKEDCREDCFRCPYPDCNKSVNKLLHTRQFWENQEALEAQRREERRKRTAELAPKKPKAQTETQCEKPAKRKYKRWEYGPKPEGMTEEDWARERKRLWNKAYRDAHQEKYREATRKYYQTHKAEKAKQMKAYRAANKDKVNATQKRWNEKNAEHCRAIRRAWYHANKDRIIAARRAKAAEKKAAQGRTADV